jgi:hypothetical protein
MTDLTELSNILQRMQRAAQTQLAQHESDNCKLYITGPGGASIDGTPQYFDVLKQQLADLERALVISTQYHLTS